VGVLERCYVKALPLDERDPEMKYLEEERDEVAWHTGSLATTLRR
jgi:hypothetical protein